MISHERKPIRLLFLMFWSWSNATLALLLDFPTLILPFMLSGFFALCAIVMGSIHDRWWYNQEFKLAVACACYVVWLTPWPHAALWLILTSWVWLLAFIDECHPFQYRLFIASATLINALLLTMGSEGNNVFFLIYHNLSLACIAIYVNFYLLEEHKRVANNASVEPLSGAYSESHLRRRLLQEVARSKYTKRALSILIFKVEDFDLFEEGLATRVLKQFLNAYRVSVTTQIRAGDEVYYLGHGDFLLLLPNCNEEGSLVLKERLIRQLESRAWPVLGSIHLIVGFATHNDTESADEMLARARHQLNKQQKTALRLVAFADS